AIDAGAVDEGEGGYLQVGRALGTVDGVGGAVQEGAVGVAVELDVGIAQRPRIPTSALEWGSVERADGCIRPRMRPMAATFRSLATHLGDCRVVPRGITLVDGPEGHARGIWRQPQGERRNQRSDPSGSLLFSSRPA